MGDDLGCRSWLRRATAFWMARWALSANKPRLRMLCQICLRPRHGAISPTRLSVYARSLSDGRYWTPVRPPASDRAEPSPIVPDGPSFPSRLYNGVSCRRGGPVANFSRPVCELAERRDDITFSYGLGFWAAEFLSVVVPIWVPQSATPLQIVRGKTL